MDESRRPLVLLLAAVTLAATTVVFLGGRGALTSSGTRPRPPSTPAQIVWPAPDFALPTFDRQLRTLSDFNGKIVILNFWASWCTPCKQEMPSLERAWNAFRNQGLVVLGIDVRDDPEDAAAFLKTLRITYPNVYDSGQERIYAYKVTALPTTIFIDRQMRIRGRFVGGYIGERGDQELREQIMTLLELR